MLWRVLCRGRVRRWGGSLHSVLLRVVAFLAGGPCQGFGERLVMAGGAVLGY